MPRSRVLSVHARQYSMSQEPADGANIHRAPAPRATAATSNPARARPTLDGRDVRAAAAIPAPTRTAAAPIATPDHPVESAPFMAVNTSRAQAEAAAASAMDPRPSSVSTLAAPAATRPLTTTTISN